MLTANLNLIEAKNLCFSYSQNNALTDLNFSIQNGDYVGLIGPNGAGKTTLIKLILGINQPKSGTITFNGKKPSDKSNSSLIGYVPQKLTDGSNAFPASVNEIIESGLNFRKFFWQPLSKFEINAVENVLDISQISHLKNRLFYELSGGERQRVLLARALVNKPKILILDEPTVGVDSKTQDKFYEFLRHLNKDHKMTIIFVSHDLGVVAKQTSRILCLNQTLFEHDDPKDLLKDGFLTQLYGQNFKFVNHHHDHV